MTYQEDALIASIRPRKAPRPNVLAIAMRELHGMLRFEVGGRYLLWQMGRWNPVNLDDVMRATNRKLMQSGRAQIVLNPSWEVFQ